MRNSFSPEQRFGAIIYHPAAAAACFVVAFLAMVPHRERNDGSENCQLERFFRETQFHTTQRTGSKECRWDGKEGDKTDVFVFLQSRSRGAWMEAERLLPSLGSSRTALPFLLHAKHLRVLFSPAASDAERES